MFQVSVSLDVSYDMMAWPSLLPVTVRLPVADHVSVAESRVPKDGLNSLKVGVTLKTPSTSLLVMLLFDPEGLSVTG